MTSDTLPQTLSGNVSESVLSSPAGRRLRRLTLWLLPGLWALTVVGLLVRAIRQPTLPGTYSVRLDELLYAGQRLLEGQLLFHGFVNGGSPLAQWLYAPSAWLGSLLEHRLLLLAISILSGVLLAQVIRNLAMAGLIALAADSPLPAGAGFLYVTLTQMYPEANSGLPEQFTNAFLVLALFWFTQQPGFWSGSGPGRGGLLLAGAAMALALMGSPGLVSPTVVVTIFIVVVFPALSSLAWILPVLLGALIAILLVFAPYGGLPDGLAMAWAGTLQLPLEEAGRFPGDSERLLPLMGEFLRLQVAGLPVWLLALIPALALLAQVCHLGRKPFSQADRLLLLPALALLFILETLSVLMRQGSERETFQLLVIPLVMLMVSGFAVMDRGGSLQRLTGRLAVLVLSLILFNNVFLVSVLHAPRQPNAQVLAVEADREATRRLLLEQRQPDQGFTAPQDVALQRQLHRRASTTGIGPEWSLNHRQLKASWATQTLNLPTTPADVCRQLTDPSNRYVVWMRTDPDGPNTEVFFRSCLNREPGHWEDISGELRLSSGEYRVFRRRSEGPMPLSSPPP